MGVYLKFLRGEGMASSVGTSFPQPLGWWPGCVSAVGYTHTVPHLVHRPYCPVAVSPLLFSLCRLGAVLSSGEPRQPGSRPRRLVILSAHSLLSVECSVSVFPEALHTLSMCSFRKVFLMTTFGFGNPYKTLQPQLFLSPDPHTLLRYILSPVFVWF